MNGLYGEPVISIDSLVEVSWSLIQVSSAVNLFISRFSAKSIALFATVVFVRLFNVICYQYKLPNRLEWSSINEQDIALITGGCNGLGQEVLKQLILGTRIKKVIVLDIADPPQVLYEAIPTKLEFHRCDIGDEVSLKKTLKQIVYNLRERGEYISICINNAGIRHSSSLLQLLELEIHRLFNVNTLSHIWIIQQLLREYQTRLEQTKEPMKMFLVTVSSVLGSLAPKNLSVYSATKAATTQIHESLSKEMSDIPGVRLLLVNTGQLSTQMFKDVIPPRPFFAPLVNHIKVAKEIVKRIDTGETGVLCLPLYSNFLPMVKCLPIIIQDLCRSLSGMDKQVKDEP